MRNVADEKCRKQLATNLQVEFVIRYSNLETQIEDEVAEWLRRQTANLLGSARVGSNPILVEEIFYKSKFRTGTFSLKRIERYFSNFVQ